MALDLTIYQLVESNLPADIVVTENYVNTRLKFWQLLLWEAAEINELDIYNLSAWGDEWLILLSYCVTYDIYQRILMGQMMVVGSQEEGSSETTTSGDIKRIVTGPTEVEYHNSKESLSELIKSLKVEGGPIEYFMGLACSYASKLGVKLPFCKSCKPTLPIMVGKRPLKGKRYYEYITKKRGHR